jgi:hypothetical protein
MRVVLCACVSSCTFGVLHDNADLVLLETGLVKLSVGFIGVSSILKHADDRRTFFSIHGG